ncbi:MAG: phosphoenolpyruvate--protein phosphotransferase, partial [Deltaproteobacteria bacterium]|nr:phosphoenolpyruvate--protein phosphotransferase [Deltaproteobacteria bacterium]
MTGEVDEAGRDDPRRRRRREGTAASPGVAIGPAHVVDRRKVLVPHRTIDKTEVEPELRRFRKALRDTQSQLEQIKSRLPHGEHRQILKAQQLMLRDPDLASHVEQFIREEHIGAEWALARVTDEIRDTLRQADNEYFRERSSDITFLAERVLVTLRGEEPEEIRTPSGAVVVAHDLSPADTAGLARTEVVGMVTAVGGPTSHSAIVARAMEIPAVVGLDSIDEEVEDGDTVIVDAIHGVVIVRPSDAEQAQWEEIRDRYEQFEDRVQREHGLPASTRDGTHITLRANVALEAEIGSALFHGAEGVGLYRTEFLFMDREVPPTEEEHYRIAKAVLRKVAPYPVVFRTFDLGSDKPTKLVRFHERERNPAMGLRSMRLALREREMFLAQLRGLLRAAVHGPLRIMVPLISGLSELNAAFDAVAEARAQLEDARVAHAEHVPVGTMIEMPSAAIIADRIAPHVDFMSIGTNDLIQYTLAIDRENDDVAYLYRPLQSAILQLIQRVSEAGQSAGIPVSLCGELA